VDALVTAATGARHSPDADRFLGTMLFTDVVGSTELLARIGDADYRALRAAHERHVRLEVEQNGGRLINVAGDGTFSLFDGPTDAVRCADQIREAAEELGISVRAGVHTGELERTGRDFTGLSVHIGARVSAMAMPNEVLVSRTVHDLVAGSGLAFVERGEHTLKGVPGSWHLYALAVADQPAPSQLGEHIARVAASPAFGDQRTVTVAQRQRGASAAMHGAATAPPCTGAIGAAQHRSNLGRRHGAGSLVLWRVCRSMKSSRSACL